MIHCCPTCDLPGPDPRGCPEHRTEAAPFYDAYRDDDLSGVTDKPAQRDTSIARILSIERNPE